MNYELARKKYTQFKFLSQENRRMNYGLLTFNSNKRQCKWNYRTQEIHTMKEDKAHITTIRIFS